METRFVAGVIADRRRMTLFQHASIGGSGKFHAFEKDILWIAQSETELEFWHGGELVKSGATFNDFYGYLTSTKFDNGLHKRIANKFKVDENSSLELKLMTTILLTPFLENTECHKWNIDAIDRDVKFKVIDIPTNYRIQTKDHSENREQNLYMTMEPIKAVREIIWHSKKYPKENEQLINSFHDKWSSNGDAIDQLRHVINNGPTHE